MAIMELNACRNELAWDILAIDDMDVLRTAELGKMNSQGNDCLLYTSPSPRD